MNVPPPIVLAMTGASGAPYAVRLLEVLLHSGLDVHLSISPSAQTVLWQELGLRVSLEQFHREQLQRTPDGRHWSERWSFPATGGGRWIFDHHDSDGPPGRLLYHHYQDFMTPMASGSHLTGGMVVCPCSGGTLSSIVTGASRNLIERAAEVHLKERRKLVLVPRETPLSLGYLRNLEQAALSGAVVLPAMPGWYHGVDGLLDLVDFIVARVLDQLGIPHQLMHRWGEEPADD
jgi:flavin prenyltransferase